MVAVADKNVIDDDANCGDYSSDCGVDETDFIAGIGVANGEDATKGDGKEEKGKEEKSVFAAKVKEFIEGVIHNINQLSLRCKPEAMSLLYHIFG